MKRTDVHAPSSPDFDPQAYVCLGVFDNHPDWGDNRARGDMVKRLLDSGFKCGRYGSGQCGHCGQPIRYAALMVRDDVKEFIYVGEDCLDNRFAELNKAEFQALRKAASLNRERQAKAETVNATFAANPWLSEVEEYGNDFLDSLYAQACRGKVLSERQVEAGQEALARAKEQAAIWEARKAAEAALVDQGVKAPEGKVKVTGEVVSVKWHDSPYGGSLKMVVKSDEGWKVWVSVPKSMQMASMLLPSGEWVEREDVAPGERVEFVATLTPSDSDPLFAFGKRPTQAKILQSA